jgi:hypothetical protein
MCDIESSCDSHKDQPKGTIGLRIHGQNSARANKPTITSCVMVGTMICLSRLHSLYMLVGDRILTQPASWMLYTAKAWSLHWFVATTIAKWPCSPAKLSANGEKRRRM